MTGKIELSPAQIRAIYDAGYEKGERDQSAAEWGCRSVPSKNEEMVFDLADILEVTVEVAAAIIGAIADA
jgi:asparagine synthetase B (glutamine-hydrolysing)